MTPEGKHLRTPKLLLGLTALGLGGCAVGWWYDAEAFYFGYLTGWFYALSIVLGLMFFVMLQHVTDSGWSVVVRRPAEGFLGTLPVLAVLSVPLLIAAATGHLFEWSHQPAPPHVAEKAAYLNLPFFFVRQGLYLLVLIGLSTFLRRKSIAQDATGDESLSWSMRKLSAPGLLVYALCFTFLSFDWIMSLQFEWFSTIFGVYVWSGSAVGGLAVLTLTVLAMSRRSLKGKIDDSTRHDLGKLIFAFAVFWAYIAFSQFFLIWYANLPEETVFFIARWQGPWKILSVLLICLRFLLPFVLIMGAASKKRPRMLMFISLVLLAGHYLDLYWLIMPNRSADGLGRTMWIDASAVAGVGGLVWMVAIRAINRVAAWPVKDPRLAESQSHGHHGHAPEAAH